MPTYDYECTKCDKQFEVFQSITANPKRTIKTDCKKCEGKAPVRRLIGTGGAILFKGSGFYETDYRSESYKKAADAEKNGGKKESKPKEGKKAGESSTSDAGSEKKNLSKKASSKKQD
jgi:putative FmdB family regulatory protein